MLPKCQSMLSRRRLVMMLAALLLVSLSAWTARAEQIDNPAYQAWAKFKPGTMVKWKQDTEAGGGNKTAIEITTTLSDLTPEKATIETKTSMDLGGSKMDLPAQKTDIPAKAEKPVPTTQSAPKPETKESEEEVEIAGRKYKCHVTESTTRIGEGANASMVHTKTWISDEVPGGPVKMTSDTQGAVKLTTKMEVVEVNVKQ